MIIRFSSNTNANGWRQQLEIDTDKKQYKFGAFLFHYADVNKMTKQQLQEIVTALNDNGYECIK